MGYSRRYGAWGCWLFVEPLVLLPRAYRLAWGVRPWIRGFGLRRGFQRLSIASVERWRRAVPGFESGIGAGSRPEGGYMAYPYPGALETLFESLFTLRLTSSLVGGAFFEI